MVSCRSQELCEVVVRVAAIDRISKDELGKQLRLKACSDQLPVSSAFLQRFRGAGARGTG
jgi:hypothetical protein